MSKPNTKRDKNNHEFSFGPNPYIDEAIDKKSVVKSISQAFIGEISAGKNTYVYDAHTYHTKVPPEGIEEFLDYYTEPGDTVLDPFCGSGMTGIAAFRKGRNFILSDLSPAAAFIAFNLNSPISEKEYSNCISDILKKGRSLEQKLYSTTCRECSNQVNISFMVWSYKVICYECSNEFVLWDHVQHVTDSPKTSKIKSEFNCPCCKKKLLKRNLSRTTKVPVQIGYKCDCKKSIKIRTHKLNSKDQKLLAKIERIGVPQELWYPKDKFPKGVNTNQAIESGIDSVDKAYTTRALWCYAWLWNEALKLKNFELRNKVLFTLTSLYKRVTVFSEFRFWGGSGNTANLNVPKIQKELNVFKAFERKAETIRLYFNDTVPNKSKYRIGAQSACSLIQIPSDSIDYVFTDPPFGSNINYSEMNFIWESWLQHQTEISEEAIVNKVQKKTLEDYSDLLTRSFKEINRVLKKDAWCSIMFHNSSSKVWQALQSAINSAGLNIQGIQTFDKKHGTFKQFVSENAVGYDLVISCKKIKASNSTQLDSFEIQDVKGYVERFLKEEDQFKVKFLHVDREDEFDYRKIYANWISSNIDKVNIELDFKDFRKIVDEVLSKRASFVS